MMDKALKELKEVRTINTPDSFVKISNESLDKAIEVLEKQDTLIEIAYHQGYYDALEEIKSKIEKLRGVINEN